MHAPLLARSALLLSLSSLSEAIVCYAPDGTTASPDFQPCIAVDGVDSMCCGIARTSNLDICQPNGLCLNTGKNSFFRDFCTDKTWNSPNCLPKNTCSDGTDGQSFLEMTQCTNGTWCCGARNFTDCCNQKLGFGLKAELVSFNADKVKLNAETVTVSVTKSFLPTETQATIPATNTVVQVVNRTRHTSSDSAKITGLIVGLVLAAILGSWAGYCLGRRKWRKEKRHDKNLINSGMTDGFTVVKPDPKPLPLPLYNAPERRGNVLEIRQFPRVSQLPAELGSEK